MLHYIGSAAFDVICNRMAPANLSFDAPIIISNYRNCWKLLKISDFLKQTERRRIHWLCGCIAQIKCALQFRDKTALRNQFVFGLTSRRAQSRLLETRDLTFDKAVQIATVMELFERDKNCNQVRLLSNIWASGTISRRRSFNKK